MIRSKEMRLRTTIFVAPAVSCLLAIFALSGVLSNSAQALTTTPTTMNFQGRLADSTGQIMPDGLYNMKFALFTVGTGGSSVWSETRENNGTDYRVQVTNGLFSTKLGEASAISASLFASGALYFEITMATPATANCSTAACASWESPMTPRHELSTSAYAYNAETLDGLDSAAFGQLSTANTWTGANTIQVTNTSALTVQKASGTDTIVTADTTNNRLKVGNDTESAAGDITLLVVDTAADTYTPTGVAGALYYDSTNDKFKCYTTSWVDCDTGGAGSTIQAAYTASTGGTTPEIKLDATRAGLDIQDSDAGIGATLLAVRAGNGSGLGTSLFDVDASNVNLNVDTVVASTKTLRVAGDTYANIDGYSSPSEGTMTYDTTNGQLLIYSEISPGSSTYKWKADKSTATVIVAASDSTQAAKNAADYVATASSAEDAINNAITAAGASGGVVYLLPGTYTIDGAINMLAGVTLAGSGEGTVITLPNSLGASINMININADSDAKIRDLKLDGNKANQSGAYNMYGMLISVTSPRVQIDNVQIIDTYSDSIYASSATNTVIKGLLVDGSAKKGIQIGSESSITNSQFLNSADDGVYIAGTKTSVTNSYFEGNGSTSAEASIYAIAANGSITGNTISGGGVGILGNGDNLTISANSISTPLQEGILLTAADNSTVANNAVISSTGDGIRSEADYNTITSNSVELAGADGIQVGSSALNNVVSSNTILNSASHGINIYSLSDNVIISNNNIHNSGTVTASSSGIYIYDVSASDNAQIMGNRISDTAGTGYAINLPGAGIDNTYLADNVYSGTGASSINDAGTDTIYASQLTSTQTLQSSSSLIKAASASALQVQNAGGSSILGVDTSASQVVFGTAGTVGGKLKIDGATSGNVTISIPSTTTSYSLVLPSSAGSANNCLMNSGTPGILAWGSCGGGGGGTQRIFLSPEFAGGLLSADGSNNNGVMTSDYDSTQDENYYNWTSAQGTLQDYDIVVRTKVPSDYSSGFGTMSIWLYADDYATAANNDIAVEVKDSGTTCSSSASYLSGLSANQTWAQVAITTSGCSSIAADDMLTIVIKTSSKDSNAVRVGGIQYQYTN